MSELKKKRKKWSEVSCIKHGRKSSGMSWKSAQVRVSLPTSRKDRGCPICKIEKKVV